jgi:hypothetical protein
MKFSKIDEHFAAVTGKASDVIRQLGFAGFAITWVFASVSTAAPTIQRFFVPPAFVPAAVCFGLGLVADAVQYVLQAILWRRLHTMADANTTSVDDEYPVPDTIDVWPQRFFLAKAAFVALGYVLYIAALLGTIARR